MKNNCVKLLYNPFERIAGFSALGWGVAGLIASTLISYWSGWHYHGLLHFGAASNPELWCFAAEHAVVWLIPALLFYIGGLLLSKSKIRIIDVLGTTAFAQLPLIGMNLINSLPASREMLNIVPGEMPPMSGLCLTIIGVVFVVWTLVWMFSALKVSCNLKGYRLTLLYILAIAGSDMLCRLIIKLFYCCGGTMCS